MTTYGSQTIFFYSTSFLWRAPTLYLFGIVFTALIKKGYINKCKESKKKL